MTTRVTNPACVLRGSPAFLGASGSASSRDRVPATSSPVQVVMDDQGMVQVRPQKWLSHLRKKHARTSTVILCSQPPSPVMAEPEEPRQPSCCADELAQSKTIDDTDAVLQPCLSHADLCTDEQLPTSPHTVRTALLDVPRPEEARAMPTTIPAQVSPAKIPETTTTAEALPSSWGDSFWRILSFAYSK